MRSSNPVIKEDTFRKAGYVSDLSEQMTMHGTVNKSITLLFLLLIAAVWPWNIFFNANSNMLDAIEPVYNTAGIMPFLWGGLIVGMIVGFVTIFKIEWSPITAPLYAIAEGLFLGALSAIMEAQFPGLVIQAVALTFGVLMVMLTAYRAGFIKVTEKLKMGITAATGAVCLIYLASMVLRMFGTEIPYIHDSGIFGIGFSLVVVGIAAFNLVLDFDLIENGVGQGAPKFMEWYGAFTLMVTLVWLYIEMLRLLAKLRDRE